MQRNFVKGHSDMGKGCWRTDDGGRHPPLFTWPTYLKGCIKHSMTLRRALGRDICVPRFTNSQQSGFFAGLTIVPFVSSLDTFSLNECRPLVASTLGYSFGYRTGSSVCKAFAIVREGTHGRRSDLQIRAFIHLSQLQPYNPLYMLDTTMLHITERVLVLQEVYPSGSSRGHKS